MNHDRAARRATRLHFSKGFEKQIYEAMLNTKSPGFEDGCLEKQKIKDSLSESLQKMGIGVVETFFLHSPDPATPLEETLEAVHALYREGKFLRFGLSKFNVKELRRVHEICAAKKNTYCPLCSRATTAR